MGSKYLARNRGSDDGGRVSVALALHGVLAKFEGDCWYDLEVMLDRSDRDMTTI